MDVVVLGNNSQFINWSWDYVTFFLGNKDKRKNGYGKFPYHFSAYLFHRNLLKECGKFNPTPNNTKKFHEMGSNRRLEVSEFLRVSLSLSHKLVAKVITYGYAMCFKRSLTKTKVKGEYVLPCPSFMKIKERLDITAFLS